MKTVKQLEKQMKTLGMWRADYILENCTLEQAEKVQEELVNTFSSVRLWNYPKFDVNGAYGWTVEL